MKIIFLDIDGVMNCRATAYGTLEKGFDATAGVLLRRIVEETGALIVVTGALGRTVSFDELKEYFERVEISGDLVLDVTKGGHRGAEISQWLLENPGIATFYIVIDDSDRQHVAPHDLRLVHTSWETGLTPADAALAITLLNR